MDQSDGREEHIRRGFSTIGVGWKDGWETREAENWLDKGPGSGAERNTEEPRRHFPGDHHCVEASHVPEGALQDSCEGSIAAGQPL